MKDEGGMRNAECGMEGGAERVQLGRLESNARLGRRERQSRGIDYVHDALQDCDDHSFMNIESFFQFLFKRGKLSRQFAFVAKQCAHFQKGADDKNRHLNSAPAVEDVGGHDRAMLGENIGQFATPAVART